MFFQVVAPCKCKGTQKWISLSALNSERRREVAKWKNCPVCQVREAGEEARNGFCRVLCWSRHQVVDLKCHRHAPTLGRFLTNPQQAPPYEEPCLTGLNEQIVLFIIQTDDRCPYFIVV